MVTLQPKLNLRVSQKQILTPGLVQMVSVLALNKLELRDMINAEMVENPVLEELEASVPLLDEVSRREEERDRVTTAEETVAEPQATEKDPFDEIDFGQYFQEYLDPGYRSRQEWEDVEKPSFENFLSRPATLTDHLTWQLSAMHLREGVAEAPELIIGNLNEEGYLTASDDELLGLAESAPEELEATPASAASNGAGEAIDTLAENLKTPRPEASALNGVAALHTDPDSPNSFRADTSPTNSNGTAEQEIVAEPMRAKVLRMPPIRPNFSRADLKEALELVRQMDPVGVGCRTLQECLLEQVKYHQRVEEDLHGDESPDRQLLADCTAILASHLKELQKKEFKEISKAIARPIEAVTAAVDYIKRLDPKPGLR